MPPSKSGIADYSDALVAALQDYSAVRVYASGADAFDPTSADIAVYHIGNNPWHDFCYETALRHPGVVVMHEANLHHLIADLTIKRGDWEAYLNECELNGGDAARAFAERVRRQEIGPDYDGLPMTRRLLQAARGLVVHSQFVANQMRQQGFAGPISIIPHGAWIPKTNRLATRDKLGIDETTPLIGAFGYLVTLARRREVGAALAMAAFDRTARGRFGESRALLDACEGPPRRSARGIVAQEVARDRAGRIWIPLRRGHLREAEAELDLGAPRRARIPRDAEQRRLEVSA